MPQKLNKAGKMQDYIPKGNGDASGEYGTSNGTNKNFTTSDKSKANVITENKSVTAGKKEKPKVIPFNEWIKKDGNKERLEKGVNKWVENKSKANVIDDDLTKTFGENEKYDKSYSNNPKLEEKLKSNIVEKLNEEFKGKSDEYIRQNGFTIAKGIASSEIRKDEFKDLKFNSFGSDSSNFDNMVRASLEQRKDLSGKKSGYDDSDIRNMDESEFDGVVSTKELWENTTKEYEKAKPILDKMGIKIEDVKFHKDKRTKDDTDNISELVYQKTGTYSGRTEEEKKAIMKLVDKVYIDKTTREFKMPKKTNKIS